MPPKDPKRSRVGKPPTIGAAPKSIWETYGLPPPPTPLPTLAPVTPGAIPPPPPTDDDRWAQGMIDTATDWRTKGSPVVRGVRTLLEKMPPIEPTPASMRAPTWLERLYDVVAPQGDTLLQQPAVQAYGALSNEVNQGFRGQLPEGVSIGALVDLPGKGPIKPKAKTRPGQLDLLGEVADDVVKDASGRVIAPKQTEIAPRPPGPWEKNVPATPAVTPEETRIAPKYKEPRYPPSTPPAAQPPVASPGSPTLKLSEVLSGEADGAIAQYEATKAKTLLARHLRGEPVGEPFMGPDGTIIYPFPEMPADLTTISDEALRGLYSNLRGASSSLYMDRRGLATPEQLATLDRVWDESMARIDAEFARREAGQNVGKPPSVAYGEGVVEKAAAPIKATKNAERAANLALRQLIQEKKP